MSKGSGGDLWRMDSRSLCRLELVRGVMYAAHDTRIYRVAADDKHASMCWITMGSHARVLYHFQHVDGRRHVGRQTHSFSIKKIYETLEQNQI